MALKLKYYYDIMSQPSRALLIFLNVAKIPYENCPVALRKGEQFDDEYKSINRFQKVPCIIHNDFKLSESVAIFRYLMREYKIPDHWYPKDSKVRAKVDEYLEWQHINTRLACARYFQAIWLKPKMGQTVSENEVNESKFYMEYVLDLFENIWLQDGNKFITGNEITVADLLAACEIEQTKVTGYNACEGRPKLQKYLETVRAETNPFYDEAHKLIYKLTPKSKL
uniref:glutathione transferase n=1 Tax=Corethrella appendiculata TaxID=1370023 RepID=U5ESX6_9DIPT